MFRNIRMRTDLSFTRSPNHLRGTELARIEATVLNTTEFQRCFLRRRNAIDAA